jgi:murein DD-endopeptidase MepM/ murein hydrolase activator NlpD
MICPVESAEVTMGFSYNTEPVYSATLKEYRSDHMGVDIGAKTGEKVKAALGGIVQTVYTDGKLGRTVVIAHENGIKTVYSNLEDNINVLEGDDVAQGDVIGYVGKTATFEIEDATHLHFEVYQDDVVVDPTPYIQ